MKKIFGGIAAIGVLFLIMWILPHITNFCVWLVSIDNTEFGFPWWLDAIIDAIAGGLAGIITKSICSFIGMRSSHSKNTLENVFSIIVGFAVAIIVHIFLEYWIVIISIIIALIILFVAGVVLWNKKQKKLDKMSDESESQKIE